MLRLNNKVEKKVDARITEYRIAQKKKKSQEQFNLLLSNLRDSVIVISEDYEILFMNEMAFQQFGANLIGKLCYQSFFNQDYPCEPCVLKEIILKNQDHYRFKKVIKDISSKKLRYFDINATLIKNYKGKRAILESFRDITEIKEIEQKLRESEKNYHDAYDQANFYKDLFIHDINNIFNVILMSLQLYKQDQKNKKKLKQMIDLTQESINKALKLISNVQKLSQLEEAKISLTKVVLSEFLDNVVKYILDIYRGKKINISINASKKKYFVKANELLLDLFENILLNAVKYNDNPIIEVLIKISEEEQEGIKYLKMEFIDNGIGVLNSQKNIIFHKGHKDQKGGRGMGFGLSLVKKIIESYNGKIWVEDKVIGDYSKGSNFIILIPEAIH